MLSLTKMLIGDNYSGDELRYTVNAFSQTDGVAEGRGPVVAWNYTRTCNLHCRHCYSRSENRHYENELNTEEALRLIDDLADFRVPALLFSGGEPLCREDFPVLAGRAIKRGIRVTLSTNGTLITPELAECIRSLGISYVGISLDGMPDTNDRFRGMPGAYERALNGVRNCRRIGQRVGFRFTLNRNNVDDVPGILDVLEREDVDRICFYHLVYSGRGRTMQKEDLSPQQTRDVLDLIIDRTLDFHRRGLKKEVLMVDNHADGPYLCLKFRESDPERCATIYRLLRRNGGNRSGMAFANIDAEGNVHPDQFTQQHTLGNVRERPFSEIWTDRSIPLLAGLKDRQSLLPETCRNCSWLSVCNGNFRSRAEAVSGDFWGFDPACYLTEEERRLPRPGTALIPSRMREVDNTDRALLNLLQEGIPLTEEPYRDLGEQLGGLSAQEVIARITRLMEDGWIRRFSGFFHAASLGYHSLLCAMHVPEEHVEEMANLISTIPGITHNYLRDHTLNMWFTLSCRRQEDLDRVIGQLESSGLTDRVYRFERLRQFKIHAAFDVREERP